MPFQDTFVYPGQKRTTPSKGLVDFYENKKKTNTPATTPPGQFGGKKYNVKDNETGKEYEVEWAGPNDPTEDELKEILGLQKGPYAGKEPEGKSHGWLADQAWDLGKKVLYDLPKSLYEQSGVAAGRRSVDDFNKTMTEDAEARKAGPAAVAALEARNKKAQDETMANWGETMKSPTQVASGFIDYLDPTGGAVMGTAHGIKSAAENFYQGKVGSGLGDLAVVTSPLWGHAAYNKLKKSIPKRLLPPDNPVVPPVTPIGGDPTKANALPPIDQLPTGPITRKQGQHRIGVRIEDVPSYTEKGYTIVDKYPDGSVLMEPPPRSRFGPDPNFGRATEEELGRPLTNFEKAMRKKKDDAAKAGLPDVEPPDDIVPPDDTNTPPTNPPSGTPPVIPPAGTAPFGAGRPLPPVAPPTEAPPIAENLLPPVEQPRIPINYGRVDNAYSIQNRGSQFWVEHPSLPKPEGPFRSYNQADKWINDQVNPFDQFPVEPVPSQNQPPPVTPPKQKIMPTVEEVGRGLDENHITEDGLTVLRQEAWSKATNKELVQAIKALNETRLRRARSGAASTADEVRDGRIIEMEMKNRGLDPFLVPDPFQDPNVRPHPMTPAEIKALLRQGRRANFETIPGTMANEALPKVEPVESVDRTAEIEANIEKLREKQRLDYEGTSKGEFEVQPGEGLSDFKKRTGLGWQESIRQWSGAGIKRLSDSVERLKPKFSKFRPEDVKVYPSEEQIAKILKEEGLVGDSELRRADISANQFLAGSGGDPMVYLEQATNSLRKIKEGGFKDLTKAELKVYDDIIEKLDNGSKTFADLRRLPDVDALPTEKRIGQKLISAFTEKLKPKFQAIRNKFGAFTSDPAEMIKRMKESFKEVTDPQEAHFITPDGKMYNHGGPLDSHASSMAKIGVDIYEALEKANIIRVGAPNAVEVGQPISRTQAKLIHDMMMSNTEPNMYVEVNNERVQRQWKGFDERATPDAIREWTNAQFEPSNTFTPKNKQLQVPKSIEEMEAAWEAGDPKKLKPKFSELTDNEKIMMVKALDKRYAEAKAKGDTAAMKNIQTAIDLFKDSAKPLTDAEKVIAHEKQIKDDNVAMHEQMQTKVTPSGMKHKPAIADPGGKLTPAERAWVENHPFVHDLMRVYSDLVDRIAEAVKGTWEEGVSHVGLTFDEHSHGVSIWNEDTGKHTILFNAMNEIMNAMSPAKAAREMVTTGKHEFAHTGVTTAPSNQVAFSITDQLDPRFKAYFDELVGQVEEGGLAGGELSGHGMDWVYRLGEVYGKFGIEPTEAAIARIESILTKNSKSGRYSPEVQNLLRLYQESKGRPGTTRDVFAGKGIQQANTKSGKKGVSGNSKSTGSGTPPRPARQVFGKAGKLNNRKFARLNPVFGKILESLTSNRNAEIAAGVPPKFSTAFVNAAAQLEHSGYLFKGKMNAQGVVPGVPAGYVRIDGGLGKFSGKYAHPEIKTVLENYLKPMPKGLLNSMVEGVGKAKSLAMSSGLIPNVPLATAHGWSMTSPFSGRAIMEGGVKRWAQAVKYGLYPKSAKAMLATERPDIIRATREYNYNPNVDAAAGHNITKLFSNTQGKYGAGKFKQWANWLTEKQHKYWEGPLFEQMLPATKWLGWKAKFAEFQAKGMSKPEAGKAASRVINDHYSGYNTDTLMETKDFKTTASLLLLAPDWMRSAKNLGINIPKSVVSELRGKATPESRAYLKAGGRMIASYAAANLLQKALTGKYMVENDPKDKFTLFLNKDETAYFNPFGSSIDFFKYPFEMASAASEDGEKFSKGAGEILSEASQNRLSPLGRLGTEFIKGEDYKGEVNLAGTTDRFGNYIPASTRFANTLSQGINFGPPQVAQPWNVATGRATPLEATLKVGEMPFGFRKPKPKPNKFLFPPTFTTPKTGSIFDKNP